MNKSKITCKFGRHEEQYWEPDGRRESGGGWGKITYFLKLAVPTYCFRYLILVCKRLFMPGLRFLPPKQSIPGTREKSSWTDLFLVVSYACVSFFFLSHKEGDIGGLWTPQHRNTAKNIAEHRITAKKVDGKPSPQYIVLVWWYKGAYVIIHFKIYFFTSRKSQKQTHHKAKTAVTLLMPLDREVFA